MSRHQPTHPGNTRYEPLPAEQIEYFCLNVCELRDQHHCMGICRLRQVCEYNKLVRDGMPRAEAAQNIRDRIHRSIVRTNSNHDRRIRL